MSYASEVLADSPAAYYRLGESSGTTLVDSSGNGRNGTLSSVTLGVTGALAGDSDTAWAMSAGHGDLADAAWQRTTAITFEVWLKTTSSGLMSILDKDANFSRNFQFRMSGGQATFFRIGATGMSTTTTSLNNGAWHHLVFTNDGTTGKFYVDGVLDATATIPGPSGATDAFTIGANQSAGYTQYFNGSLDEVAIYNTALSASRIAAHYTAGTTVATGLSGSVAATSSVSGALATRGIAGTVAATSTVSGAMTSGGSGLSGAVVVTSGTSGATVNPTEPDESAEYAPELTPPSPPTVTTVGRTLVSVATSLPFPTLVDGRPQ